MECIIGVSVVVVPKVVFCENEDLLKNFFVRHCLEFVLPRFAGMWRFDFRCRLCGWVLLLGRK